MKTILLLALIGCTVVSAQNAVAVLKSSIINGVVRFSPTDDNRVLVSINITNLLPSGRHGFHIHQFGDLTDGCVSAGPHFNPLGLTHGAPSDLVRHVGDLGNIVADSFGTAYTQIIDNQIALSGPNSIIGRAVVVHALTDDLGRGTGTQEAESKKTGNAGARVACAVIGLAKN